MTLEQLRIFVAVAERQHVTRAAEKLNLTQSATSAAIAALETRYATKLFDRVGRRIELSNAGRLFLTEARAVLAQAAAAEALLTDLAGLKRGTLSLAASQTVANYCLPGLMHRFRKAYPGFALQLRIGNTEQVNGWVNDIVVDLGFVEGEIQNPALSVTPFAVDELVLVASPAHVDAVGAEITAADLAAIPWVLREEGSGTRATFEMVLAQFELSIADCTIALELPSNEAVLTAVEYGAGATIVSEVAACARLKAGSLIRRGIALPSRQFFALRHRERSMTRAQAEFLRLTAQGSHLQ